MQNKIEDVVLQVQAMPDRIRPGGKSVHVIESGELDYASIDRSNPDEPLLRYVRLEGHVGIEPPDRLKLRWEQYFSAVSAENAFVFPFAPPRPGQLNFSLGVSPRIGHFPQFQPLFSQPSRRERRSGNIWLPKPPRYNVGLFHGNDCYGPDSSPMAHQT
ncbi:MAG: hypothetical protein M3Y27_12620 [Acidobacteriota bacterium]|nr:hypothetical protein [Acidobacteriota bacterium]